MQTDFKRVDATDAGVQYEQDFVSWLQAQAALLRSGQCHLLDCRNLADEVEGMVRREHRELRS